MDVLFLALVANERIVFGQEPGGKGQRDPVSIHWMLIKDTMITDEGAYNVGLTSSLSPLPVQCSFELLAVDQGSHHASNSRCSLLW